MNAKLSDAIKSIDNLEDGWPDCSSMDLETIREYIESTVCRETDAWAAHVDTLEKALNIETTDNARLRDERLYYKALLICFIAMDIVALLWGRV